MKIYQAYFEEYEDRTSVGAFSSEQKAREALKHFYENAIKERGYFYYRNTNGYVDEWEIDDYYHKHLNPLSKALE